MIIYSLVNDDIHGDSFKHFLAYCLKNSTYFSVTFHDYEINKYSKFYKELEKYLEKMIRTYTWYQYKTFENPLNIGVYHSNLCALDNILNQFDTLFKNKDNGIEDLCFFCNENLLFGSVTHIEMAQLFLKTELELSNFEKFAQWEKMILTSRDYEYLPSFKFNN